MRVGILDNDAIASVINVISSYDGVNDIHDNGDGTISLVSEDIQCLSNVLFEDHGIVLIIEGDDEVYSVGSLIHEGIVGDIAGAVTDKVKDVAKTLTGDDIKNLQQDVEETEESPDEARAKNELENRLQQAVAGLKSQGFSVPENDTEVMKSLTQAVASLEKEKQ